MIKMLFKMSLKPLKNTNIYFILSSTNSPECFVLQIILSDAHITDATSSSVSMQRRIRT